MGVARRTRDGDETQVLSDRRGVSFPGRDQRSTVSLSGVAHNAVSIGQLKSMARFESRLITWSAYRSL